jgi:hypothetical protein
MTTSQHPPLPKRVFLKLKRIARELDPVEREWSRAWPLIEPIQGWLHSGQERWLFNTARACPDRSNIVEIGSYRGRSSCSLGFGCQRSGKRVYAIDRFDGGPDLPQADSLEEFARNVERCGLSKIVQPVVGLSTEVAKTWSLPIRLLFVDGSHRYEDVVADFAAFFPFVVPGGIVAFHDVEPSWPGVLRAWNEVIKQQLIELGDCSTLSYGLKP